MLSVSTLSVLTTQCATRYYGPRTHSPATETSTPDPSQLRRKVPEGSEDVLIGIRYLRDRQPLPDTL